MAAALRCQPQEEDPAAVALQQHTMSQICDGCSKFLLLTEIQVSSA